MGAYKLLAIDMDGTLLRSDKTISPSTVEALGRATEAGVACALATGRAISELADYERDLTGIVRFACLLSGAQVADLATGRSFSVRPLGAELVRKVCAHGHAVNAMVQLFTDSVAVMERRDVERMPELGQGIYQSLAYERGLLVDDIVAWADEHGHEVLKANVHHVDEATLASSWEAFGPLPITCAGGESLTIEMTAKGVTKGTGIAELCEHLGIAPSEVVCVGDSENDLAAISVAGLSVAMGNACPPMLEAADAVVADNDHDGIVELVERWLL